MWTMCHVMIFGLDLICYSIFVLINRLKKIKKKTKLVEEKNDTTAKTFEVTVKHPIN